MGNIKLLKLERIKRDKSQADIAKVLNCSVPAYSLKENGKRPFSQKEIAMLAEMFDMTGDTIKEVFFETKLNTNSKTELWDVKEEETA